MALGPGRLKLVSGISTLAVCGAGTLLVTTDPKPAGAPLTPPVTQASESGLVIPPSCGSVRIAGTGARSGAPAQLSAAARQAVARIRAAKGDKAAVRAILAGLSAQDRQMVTAALRNASGDTSCGAAHPAGGSSESITASVGSGGAAAPVVISYVS